MMRVLLVEDNLKLATVTIDAMRSYGFTVDRVATAHDAEEAAANVAYEAIVLDLGLPDRDGLLLIEPLQRIARSTPVLVLTARDAPASIMEALDRGADDYLCKPFVMGVLISRLRALMRRGALRYGVVLREGNVKLDLSLHVAHVDAVELQLSRREYSALELFLRRANHVMSKSDVEESLYGFGEELSSNAVEVLIHRLRKKLKTAGALIDIHNMRGIGYMLADRRP